MKRLAITGAIFAIFASADSVRAEDCSKALIVDTYAQGSESSRDYRLSEYVSEQQWQSLRSKAGASAVIYGVPVGGSYDQYKAASQEKLSARQEHLSEYQAQNVLWTGLGGASLEAYKTCLQANRDGLYLFVRSATKSQLELVTRYGAARDAADLDLFLVWRYNRNREHFAKAVEKQRRAINRC